MTEYIFERTEESLTVYNPLTNMSATFFSSAMFPTDEASAIALLKWAEDHKQHKGGVVR